MQEMTIQVLDRLVESFPSISLVTDDWMADVMEVDPDLVSPPGVWKSANVGEMWPPSKDFIKSDCFPRFFASRRYPGSRAGIPTDGDFDLAR